jgi:hypothetical protein
MKNSHISSRKRGKGTTLKYTLIILIQSFTPHGKREVTYFQPLLLFLYHLRIRKKELETQ